MKVEIKNINKTKKKVHIDLPHKMVDEAFGHIYKKIGGQAKIKGFRAGKIPSAVLDQHYGPDILMESTNWAVGQSYQKALVDNQIYPVSPPKFNVETPLEKGKPYKFSVEIEVRPEFDLKDYLGIPIKKKIATITPKEVEDELKKIQEARAQLKPAPADISLQAGHVGSIDFEGTINGKPFQGGSAKGHLLEVGKGTFLKEFEDKIIGMQTGETRKIDVSFPDNYPAPELKSQTTQFTITLHAIYEKDFPKIDDELAKDLGKDSLETVKKEISEMLTKRKERSFKNDYAEEAMDFLLKKHKMEIPEGLLEEEKKRTKKPEDEITKQIRSQFILEAVAQKEKIEVTPQELQNRVTQMAKLYGRPLPEVIEHYKKNNLFPQLASQIMIEKTIDFIIEKAKLED